MKEVELINILTKEAITIIVNDDDNFEVEDNFIVLKVKEC